MIYLKSVGSYIDENTANIYPAFDNGKCDLENPISLSEDEVASDWFDALSKEEHNIVMTIKKNF